VRIGLLILENFGGTGKRKKRAGKLRAGSYRYNGAFRNWGGEGFRATPWSANLLVIFEKSPQGKSRTEAEAWIRGFTSRYYSSTHTKPLKHIKDRMVRVAEEKGAKPLRQTRGGGGGKTTIEIKNWALLQNLLQVQ